jgi:cell division septation protein DedD
MSQQDLFDFSSRSAALPKPSAEMPAKTPLSFLEQTRISLRLDHLLTLSIALMVATSLIYASGIEKGKRSGWTMNAAAMQAKKPVVNEAAVPVEIKGPESGGASLSQTASGEVLSSTSISSSSYRKTETRISAKKTTAAPDGSFTIQLATYKAESIAQKRVEALSSQGLEGFLIPSGSYYQVCVNGFSKKVEATQSLTRLKSKGIAPRDAYVRMIPA